MNKASTSLAILGKSILKKIALLSILLDFLLLPVTIISLIWYRLIKFLGVHKFPLTKKLFYTIGALPIVKHYYEPLFDPGQLSKPLNSKRVLPAINLNLAAQINFIQQFNFQNDLKKIPIDKNGNETTTSYFYNNGAFPAGDAECYYAIIRQIKPNNIIEIGSGFSTLIALEAIKKNEPQCKLTCVEPYERPWLEDLDVEIIREKVELLPGDFFSNLKKDDILFIDSSHIIRPQGDVLYEILEVLPKLNKGVLIHFHDIFTPNDYPLSWLTKEFRLWDEQYLLEAFLSNNPEFEIICALNYLGLHHREVLNEAFPIMAQDLDKEPCSFWIKKIN
jgi:Methyltransferase domain